VPDTIKLVRISRLLTNRSPFMVKLGMAGIPITQFWPHMRAVDHFHRTDRLLPAGSAYARLCNQSAHRKDGASGEYLRELYASIKGEGIKEPLKGYYLGDDYELAGGHHRAICAHYVGLSSVPVRLLPFDPLSRIKLPQSVSSSYGAVEAVENLPKGRSYNPFPGRKHIRSDLRMRMLYRAIIDTKGTRLLDAGCNDGYFGVTLAHRAFDVTLVDKSEAYLGVVTEKLAALKKKAHVINATIRDLPKEQYDVTLYTDVFYHVVIRESLKAGLEDWHKLLAMTDDRMIFGPGRWDKLEANGFTEQLMWDEAEKAGFRIRLLGFDSDQSYGRPLFCLMR